VAVRRQWPFARLVPVGDAALAALCLLLCEVAVWTGAVRGPQLANAVLLGLVACAVALRTRAPLLAVGITASMLGLQVILFGATESAGLTIAVFALSYAVAAHTEGRRLVAGLTLLLAVGLLHEARDQDIHTFVDALFVPIVIAVAASLGFAVAQMRARADLAEEHVRMAEVAKETAARLAAGEERERIARELHDILAHSVSVMVVQAEAADELLDKSPERARGPVNAVQRTGREALTELRMLLGAMRADDAQDLVPQPGLGQLPDLVEEAAAAGQAVDLRIEGDLATLSPVVGTTIYRVVQEALTNARKHAPSAPSRIGITSKVDGICVDVVNGRGREGRTVTGAGPGHGLIGMRERVELCGGTFLAARTDEGGFRVRAELPGSRP
jgi:signal transduction histidine kinase